MRFRRKKKKEKKWVHLELEKDGETKTVSMRVGKKIGMLKIAKKLTSLGKQGWQLKDISGDPGTVGMFNSLLSGYHTGDPVPIKKMVKAAGLAATPGFIKKLIKKDKEKPEEVAERVEIDYSDFPEGKEVTVLKLKEKKQVE